MEPVSIMPLAGLEERLKEALARTEGRAEGEKLEMFRGAAEEMLGYLRKAKAGEPQKYGLWLAKNIEFLLREFEKEFPAKPGKEGK